MKAFRLEEVKAPLVARELPIPEPKGHEVLIRVRHAGVCHSDLHIWQGGWGPLKLEQRGIKLPLVLGHEVSGVVEAVGEEVRGIQPGDEVVVYPWLGDGTCKLCTVGLENLCLRSMPLGIRRDGGFQEYVLLPDAKYAMKALGIPLESGATLACAGLTAYNALQQAAVGPSDYLVVIGVGGLGHMAVELACNVIRPFTIAVDIREEALALAKAKGADATINIKQQDVVEEVLRLTGGVGADAVIDFVGVQDAIQAGFNMLRRGGRLVEVGLGGDYLSLIQPLIPSRAITIVGCYTGSLAQMQAVLQLMRRGLLRPSIVRMALHEVNQALELLRQGRVAGRIVLSV